jgi:hypothetical protein
MPQAAAADPRQTGDAQLEQQGLVEQGRRLPGVADAIDAYGRVAPYAPGPTYSVAVPIRNATGGNATDADLGGDSPRTG